MNPVCAAMSASPRSFRLAQGAASRLYGLNVAPGFSPAWVFAVEGECFMAYSDKVVDHYNNPRNVGSLPKEDPNVGTGLVGAPECGDVMKLQMRINPETQVIEEARFKTFGCGSAIASSSLATEWVKGKTVEEALSIKNTDIVRELALPPVKIHCSVLAEDAIKAAIGNWKNKKGLPVTETEKASH
jgi:nitrogen fixation protein NifU and related proteins